MPGYTVLLLLALPTLALAQARPAPDRLYVAPDGRDEWSGRLPQPNAARTDGPFASLPRAQAAVRDLKARGLTRPVEVVLQAGTYALTEPLVFRPEDSGTEACPITYRAADGAEVVISGGVGITGWRERGGVWTAPLPEAFVGKPAFRLLRVGDRWAIRARHPNYDPTQPYTGGWAFADFGGEPWERGALGTGVANTHNPGTRLTWRVRLAADGQYRVWLRYGHNMKQYDVDDMAGRTVLKADGGPVVPLQNLPDTGSWGASTWAHVCDLALTQGEHILTWENRQGGGINLDAWALCDDEAWDPNTAVGQPAWWGAFDVKPPAQGRHVVIIQAEACETAEGAELQVSKPTPPGTTTQMAFREGALPRWTDVAGAEVHIFIAWGWVNAIVPIERIEYEQRRIVFTEGGAAQDVRIGNRFFVENVREALDAPGEWYVDAKLGSVLYLADDARFPNLPVVAPRLDRLIAFEGDPAAGQFVEHIHLQGLRFADTDYTLTRNYYTPADATVILSGARQCSVRGCEFGRLGGYGVKLANRSQQCAVSRNHMHHLGQGGVILVGGTADQPHHCSILGNTMEHLGLIYKHVAGVYVVHGSDNRIAHNRITDVPRYAISCKSQGEENLAHRNVVEFNEIRRCNLETNDTGAIETLGYEHRDSGNIIRHNLILDSIGLGTSAEGELITPHFTWGVYLDDYSSGTTVYGNIIARTVLGGVCIHGGQNNVIQNNILVDGRDHQVRLQPRDEFMQGNRFVNNVVVYARPEAALVYCYNDRRDLFAEWDRNVYWLRGADLTTLNASITPQGTWAQWLAAGFDPNSKVADPLFVDADHDDYRLQPDSPAFALGFQPIPVERIGLAGLADDE
jgi:parallel beta-helix repeat protein